MLVLACLTQETCCNKTEMLMVAVDDNADKAWVPTGTHYLDKQAHDALAPKRPPNSPQGNKCPSPASSRRHKPPTSFDQGRASANSPSRPPWDSWGSPSKPSKTDDNSPSQGAAWAAPSSPGKAALKKMTASWSPGRKGFVKPELAQVEENKFSHSGKGDAAARRKQTGKAGKKKSSPKRASATAEPTQITVESGKPAKTSSGGSIWAGTLAGPQSSFLQPILHSQQGHPVPKDEQTAQDRQSQPGARPRQRSAKKKKSSGKGGKHAHMHRQRPHADEEEAELDSEAQAQSPPRVYTLDQSPRGSYVSPLRASHRRALSGLGDSPLVLLGAHQHAPASMRSLDFPPSISNSGFITQRSDAYSPGPCSSTLSAQASHGHSGIAMNSKLNAQLSESDGNSSCTASSAVSTQYSEESAGEGEAGRSWAAHSTQPQSGNNVNPNRGNVVLIQ